MYYVDYIFIGVVVGCMYALYGLGLTVVYKATRVANFAQGAVGTVAAFVFYKFWRGSGIRQALKLHAGFYFSIPFLGHHSWARFSVVPPALPMWGAWIVALTVTALLGLVVGRLMRVFAKAPTVTLMIVSFGVLSVLLGLAYNIFSGYQSNVHHLIPTQGHTHFTHGFFFNDEQLMMIAVTVALTVALGIFFRRTHLGVAIRAVADNQEVSQLLGINARTVSDVSWVLGSLLAGVAGILLTPIVGLDLAVLTELIVYGFVASLVGGFRSLLGTLAGGVLLGVVQQLVIASPISRSSSVPPLPDVVAFLVIVVLLMLRPRWIFSGIRVDEESGVGGMTVTFGTKGPAEDQVRGLLRRGGALWLALEDWKVARWVLGGGALLAVMVIPIFTTGYWASVLATGLIFTLVGLSIVVLTGWTGQVSLAQFAFVGVGAYTASILSGTAHLPFWLVVPITVAVSVPFSLFIGIPSLRLRGFFLALVTLAFAVALDANVFLSTPLENHNSVQWTTTKTINGIAQTIIHRPFGFTSEVYYLGLAVTLGCFFLMWNLRRTRTARAFLAIRDSEPTAVAFGINPTKYKLLAFCIGGGIAAAAGSIFAYLYVNVDPSSFLFLISVTFIGYAVITGIAELLGAALVGFFFAVVPQLLATPVNGVNQTIPILTGALLILTVYSYPTGQAGFLKRLVRPDDETRVILTATQFTPAPARVDLRSGPPSARPADEFAGTDAEEAEEAEEAVWSRAAEVAAGSPARRGGDR